MPNTTKTPLTITRILRGLPGAAHAKTRRRLTAMVEEILLCRVSDSYLDTCLTSMNNHHLTVDAGSPVEAVVLAVAAEVRKIVDDKRKAVARNAEILHAVDHGCPQCGAKVKRNWSLTGWWQCSQSGAVGFRADASKPSCSWQMFWTEI